jgi:hypothetical protein
MSYIEKKLVKGTLLTDSAVTLYTVTTPVISATIKEILFCNTHTTPVTVSFHVVATGDSADESNAEFYEFTLRAKETRLIGRNCVMEDGDTIQALASVTSKVSINVSGTIRT